jgi:hypothetical protein
MSRTARTATLIAVIILVAGLGASASGSPAWLVYVHQGGAFVRLNQLYHAPIDQVFQPERCGPVELPASWHVLMVLHADLTRDGERECALLVWRPWQDWPIMRWSDTPSPIAANRDAQGDSAHIILIEPTADSRPQTADGQQRFTYRELWAGSALAVPITQIAAGDVDGDGWKELVVLEGDYATGRFGPARHVAVWRWNGFGFTLDWRSPPDRFVTLALADLDGNGGVEILAR